MDNLPELSRASASKGLWFVFKDGAHTIRAWGSYWTGLERIYFDNDLILQAPSRADSFEFQHQNNVYRIEFCTRSVAIGQMRCSFEKNSEVLSTYASKRRKVINVRPIAVHIFAALVFGLLTGILNLPLWSSFVCIMLAFALTLLSNAKTDDFIIEEVQLQ